MFKLLFVSDSEIIISTLKETLSRTHTQVQQLDVEAVAFIDNFKTKCNFTVVAVVKELRIQGDFL